MAGMKPGRSEQMFARSEEAYSWTFDVALPFWGEHGVDRKLGGFVEHLSLDGLDAQVSFKRVRAQARQIYVFAHAALLGWYPGQALAEHGWSFLNRHGRRDDGGWVRSMRREGGILDPTCDAYDMAFVLFAHAWMFRLSGDDSILQSALKTVSALDQLLAHSSGLGWHAFEGCQGAREQNPHMHLIEAAIELAASTGHERFVELARTINDLFQERLFDQNEGLLREFFYHDWSSPDPERGHIVEPGHMLEWSWILRRAEQLVGLDVGDTPAILYRRALAIGEMPATGLIVDQVDPTGRVLAGGFRSWPQTEALKAHLSAFEAGDETALDRGKLVLDNLLDRYLSYDPQGCWIDQLDRDLRPSIDKVPSTTFYHIFLAFSELERVRQVAFRGDSERLDRCLVPATGGAGLT